MSGRRGPNPLWSRSPLVLRRYPGLLVAVAAGALLLAATASSSPLFLSAAAGSAVRERVAEVSTYRAGLTIRQRNYLGNRAFGAQPAVGLPGYRERDAAIRRAAGRIPDLGPRLLSLLGSQMTVVSPGNPERSGDIRLLFRTGALSHVTRLAGGGRKGLWLSDSRAADLGVRPGDRVRIVYSLPGSPNHTADVAVAGVYRALWKEPPTPYWRDLYGQIYPPNPDAPPPPTFALVDEAGYASVSRALRAYVTDVHWEFPLAAASPTLGQARQLEARLAGLQAGLESHRSAAGRVMHCGELRCETATSITAVVSGADQEVSALRGPADLLATAGTLVALAVLAAVGAFLVARRRQEAALLHARGMSPALYAAKSALEVLAPALAGTAAGFGLAYAVVRALGPRGPVDLAALADAAGAGAIRLPLALAVLALVAALVFRALAGTDRRRAGLFRLVPWELGLLAVAGLCLMRLTSGHALVREAGGVARPSSYVLLFPIFFVAGFAGLVARVWGPALRAARARAGRLPPGLHLAVSRLAAAERLAVLLVAASALSLGIFVYAQTIVRSLGHSIDAKAALFVGSDVDGTVNADQTVPAGLGFPVTKVTKVVRGAEDSVGGNQVDLLAVDPRTFASAAYWDSSWSADSLDRLLARLAEPTAGALPVILAGGSLPGGQLFVSGETRVPVRMVGRASAFPGIFGGRPLVVASFDGWTRAFRAAGVANPLVAPGSETQLWVKGDEAQAAAALRASPARPFEIVTAGEIRRNPSIAAASRTFAFLKALGFSAGLLAVVGMLLYLQARQRSRVVSYALSRRMGLGGPAQHAALFLELGTMLLFAFALAVVLALLAARIVLGDVDPLPELPPTPLFRVPGWLLVGTGIGLLAVSGLGGALAARASRRTRLSEVMRLGD